MYACHAGLHVVYMLFGIAGFQPTYGDGTQHCAFGRLCVTCECVVGGYQFITMHPAAAATGRNIWRRCSAWKQRHVAFLLTALRF